AVSDGQGNTNVTGYKYFDPVVAPDTIAIASDGTVLPDIGRRFRGFQAVQTTLPLVPGETVAPVKFERFTYRHDPDGLLDYASLSGAVSGFAGAVKQTVDHTSYATEVFLSGNVRFSHPMSTTHIECIPSTTSSDCDGQTTFLTESRPTYEAFISPRAGP